MEEKKDMKILKKLNLEKISRFCISIDVSFIYAIFYVLLHGDDFQHTPCPNHIYIICDFIINVNGFLRYFPNKKRSKHAPF